MNLQLNASSFPIINQKSRSLLLSGKLSKSSKNQLFILSLDTRNIRRITNEGSSYPGSFNEDGSKIVYSYRPDISNTAGDREIYIMNSDGSNKRKITKSLYPKYNPLFSNVNNEIIYIQSKDYQTHSEIISPIPSGWYRWNIYSYNILTKKEKQLTIIDSFLPFYIYHYIDEQVVFEYEGKLNSLNNKALQVIKLQDDMYIGQMSISNNKIMTKGKYYGDNVIYIYSINGEKIISIKCSGLSSLRNFNILDNNIIFLAEKDEKFNLFKVGLDGTNLHKIDLSSFSFRE